MQSLIILLLFVGMFLVVQSVYEDKVRRLEAEAQALQQKQASAEAAPAPDHAASPLQHPYYHDGGASPYAPASFTGEMTPGLKFNR